MPLRRSSIYLAASVAAAFPPSARPGEPLRISLTLKDRIFAPAGLKAPAGKDIAIMLKNEDGRFKAFDSGLLRTEKIVTAEGKVTIKLSRLPWAGIRSGANFTTQPPKACRLSNRSE
jgi:hypothetical protein